MAIKGYSLDGYGMYYSGDLDAVDLKAFEVDLDNSLVVFGVDDNYCYINLDPDYVGDRYFNTIPSTTVSADSIQIDFDADGINIYRNGDLIITI